MAIKLDLDYELSLAHGGSVRGELVEFPADSGVYCIKTEWTPDDQHLTPTDGGRVRECQDLLRNISSALNRLAKLENEDI